MATRGVTISDNLEAFHQDLADLANMEVLAGFPEETTDEHAQRDADGEEPITNAALAYIHDNGAPEVNIPQRQFMIPAIEENQDKITNQLVRAARSVLLATGNRDAGRTRDALAAVGLAAERAIKKKINEGVPPPLSEYTLRQRAERGRKGAQAELDARAQGLPPGTDLAKPLVDTANMRNAATYVIRNRRDRPRE